MALELKPLLGILRDKFPKKNLGNVSNDIERLVKTFAHGMLVSVKKPGKTLGYEEDLTYASCETTIGRLNQTDDELHGKVKSFINNSSIYPIKNFRESYHNIVNFKRECPQKNYRRFHHPM